MVPAYGHPLQDGISRRLYEEESQLIRLDSVPITQVFGFLTHIDPVLTRLPSTLRSTLIYLQSNIPNPDPAQASLILQLPIGVHTVVEPESLYPL